jgi:type IV secretory pathway VirB2 component (pilin)
MKNIKRKVKKIKDRCALASVTVTALLLTAAPVSAASSLNSKGQTAADSIAEEIRGALPWTVLLSMLIVGVACFVPKGREFVKSHVGWVLLGIFVVNGAPALAPLILTWFG